MPFAAASLLSVQLSVLEDPEHRERGSLILLLLELFIQGLGWRRGWSIPGREGIRRKMERRGRSQDDMRVIDLAGPGSRTGSGPPWIIAWSLEVR
jgi:hypothetical protein